MAYTLKVDGMEEISETLTKLAESAQAAAALGLYEGAGIMADAIKSGAESISAVPFRYVFNGWKRLPSPEEKAIVTAASAGIAKFDKNGAEVNTSVGYRSSGYATLNGKVKPIPLIVNAINSGTSFMSKQPFIRRAAKSGAPKAIEAIKAKIDEVFDATINKK